MMSSKERTQRLVADPAGIEEAARVLAAGGLVALPTETVYGLAARADDNDAVAAIYAAKGRPSFNPLIVHVASLEAAHSLAMFDATALELARWAWPGPLTLVLPRSPDARLAEAVTAGLPTVAVRVPSHPVMRTVLEACGLPLAAPSANRSGAVSPTSAQHVLQSLKGRIDLVLDAGASPRGLESTIVAVRADSSLDELRPGPLDLADFTAKLRGATSGNGSGGIEAPGQLARHYAPGKPLRLDATQPDDDEYFIGFASASRADCNLSPSGDLTEAAAQLYACLHLAAASAKPRIAVAPVPMEGVGRAINDRLRRAAA